MFWKIIQPISAVGECDRPMPARPIGVSRPLIAIRPRPPDAIGEHAERHADDQTVSAPTAFKRPMAA